MWSRGRPTSICCAGRRTALRPGLRMQDLQPKRDAQKSRRGSRSHGPRIGKETYGQGSGSASLQALSRTEKLRSARTRLGASSSNGERSSDRWCRPRISSTFPSKCGCELQEIKMCERKPELPLIRSSDGIPIRPLGHQHGRQLQGLQAECGRLVPPLHGLRQQA